MSLGQVSVNNENKAQGGVPGVENYFLFIGVGPKNRNNIVYLNGDSDLDVELGAADSALKTNITAARVNAGDNWSCAVLPLTDAKNWAAAVDQAMDANLSVESIVMVDPITSVAMVNSLHTKAMDILGQHKRNLFFIARSKPMDPVKDSWGDFITASNALVAGVNGCRVSPVADVTGNFLGVYAGRLCSSATSVADTPMRVATGPLLGIGSTPVDKDGVPFNNAHAKALNDARYTVPQTYADYPGLFCSDGMTLDAPAGDFQVIEHLRVVDKAARQIRVLAIPRVGDRKINDTAISMAAAVTYFMRPLIDMAVSAVVKGEHYPGEIEPPEDGDVTLVWLSNTELAIYISVQPYKCPKKIKANISLDLS